MADPREAYVWIWLPGATKPVVAGRVFEVDGRLWFNYGRSYLARVDAMPLYLPELPLVSGAVEPPPGLGVAGVLRDAAPDYWGQRVVLRRLLGAGSREVDHDSVGLLTYLLESGSNRFGALDFQVSPTTYVERSGSASLEDLMHAARSVEQGAPLPEGLEDVFAFGTGTLGGARPKATISEEGVEYLAKFESVSDLGPVVKGEAAALELARRVGLDVPESSYVEVGGRGALLVRRFDRGPGSGERRMAVSALTLMGLDELWFREATYWKLGDLIRERFDNPTRDLTELFKRIAFNICIGNDDDHPRNHAAFWDGECLSLTPVFDLEMRQRANESTWAESFQAMAFGRDGTRVSSLAALIDVSETYLVGKRQAREIVEHMVSVIDAEWEDAAEVGHLTSVERSALRRSRVLRAFAVDGI